MVALLILLARARAEPHVTLTTRGETVAAVLRDVSIETGIALAAVPETAGDVVIVSVDNVPMKSFQDHLAEAIGATWRMDGGVEHLVRPVEMLRAQEAAEK